MLKLPKNILQHPRLPAVEAYFTANTRLLRVGGKVLVSRWALDEPLKAGLRAAFGTGHLVQGLELIESKLDREAKGLRAVREKSGQPPAERLSRLLLMANDGSPRFYHDADSLLAKHADRVWGCLVEAPSTELGMAFTPKGNPTKALMIDDKDALGLFLAAIAQNLP